MIDDLRRIFSRFYAQQKRNLWATFGYPDGIDADAYWRRYMRDGIARRVVRSLPDACWRGLPTVRDEQGVSAQPGDPEYSPFVEAWEDLNDRVDAMAFMARVDRLARIGHFGILVLGFEGDEPLTDPAPQQAQLIYLQAYAERSVMVTRWDQDVRSPRYGLPEVYRISPVETLGTKPQSAPMIRAFDIHHSRVIHVAEGKDESDVWGEPALRSVWNYLLDLEKVLGSGAETYWFNARGGIAIEAAADAQIDDIAREQMRQQAEDYENELRRFLALQGATAKPLVMAVAEAKQSVDMLITMIAGATGIPQRILTGSERGELASSTDQDTFESRIDERRQAHCAPAIVWPFIQRMIATGNLPEPQGFWDWVWPEVSALSPEKQATIALTRAQAMATYAGSAADLYFPPEEFRPMLGLAVTPERTMLAAPLEDDDLDDDPFEDDQETQDTGEGEDA